MFYKGHDDAVMIDLFSESRWTVKFKYLDLGHIDEQKISYDYQCIWHNVLKCHVLEIIGHKYDSGVIYYIPI